MRERGSRRRVPRLAPHPCPDDRGGMPRLGARAPAPLLPRCITRLAGCLVKPSADTHGECSADASRASMRDRRRIGGRIGGWPKAPQQTVKPLSMRVTGGEREASGLPIVSSGLTLGLGVCRLRSSSQALRCRCSKGTCPRNPGAVERSRDRPALSRRRAGLYGWRSGIAM